MNHQSESDIAAIRDRLDAEAWEAYHGGDQPEASSPEGREAIDNIIEEMLSGDTADVSDSITDGLSDGLTNRWAPADESDAEYAARMDRAQRVERDTRALGSAILHCDEAAAGAIVVRLVRAYVAEEARKIYDGGANER